MKGSIAILGLVVLAAVNAQTQTNNNNTCLSASILTAYNLVTQSPSITNNGTCVNYFSTSGACVTPGSVAGAMTVHNNWLAGKAQDAQVFALQYINATVYWQTQNKVITTSTTVDTNTNWWNSFVNTLSSWWTAISNRATAIFNTSYTWIKNVFNNNVSNIPNCLNAWGNITNGAYCLASSASSFVYSTNIGSSTGDLALGVDLTTTGSALSACASLIDTYCQITYGISITNTSAPFNQTFNWNDGGLTSAQCQAIQTAYTCGNSCQSNLYNAYINLYQSYFIRFIPSQQSSANLGTFYNTTNTPTQYVAVQAAAGNSKSFWAFSTTTGGANLQSIGQNSGQPSKVYVFGSVARFCSLFVAALLAIMF